MPVVAAAVCPHPPLIVPEVAAGAAPELDPLRAACSRAVRGLLAAGPDLLVIVGSGPETLSVDGGWSGTLAPYGVDLRVPLVPGDTPARTDLPLSLTIGAWLLNVEDSGCPRRALAVASRTDPAGCAALGAGLSDPAAGPRERTALLVMGDGPACHTEKAPGYLDMRARPYEDAVAAALASADAAALLELDPVLSERLMVAGRAPWQVLAGAVRADARRWSGELAYRDAPYGVGYLVASWWPAP